VKLANQGVLINALREPCFEVAAAGRRLGNARTRRGVVEFKTRVGARDVRRLSLEPPSAIHHRRLESRLPKVREPIRFIEIDDSKTRPIYTGRLSLGKGVVWIGDRAYAS
jgi:hypothetical protein